MARSNPQPAPPVVSPYDATDLENARQLRQAADNVLPLLQAGQNCGLVACESYVAQVMAQREFAQKVLDNFGAG